MYVHANENINKQIEHIEMQQEGNNFNLLESFPVESKIDMSGYMGGMEGNGGNDITTDLDCHKPMSFKGLRKNPFKETQKIKGTKTLN